VGSRVVWLPALFLRSYFRDYRPHPLFPSALFGSDCEQSPQAMTLLLVRDSSCNQIHFVVERDGAIVAKSYNFTIPSCAS
jgi:hypothetical protein